MTITYEQLYELGFSLFPIAKGTKVPADRWSQYQKKRADLPQLKRWFEKGGNNWGIACGEVSNLVVVDCDDLKSSRWALENLPMTAAVSTSKGIHLYYSHPGVKVGNRTKIKHPNIPLDLSIDIRGDGGYVLGPGSIHPSGSIYEAFLPDIVPGESNTLDIF